MRSIRALAACFLALLWLPVTQHCGLEAAELLASACAGDDDAADCASEKDACATDSCASVEEGSYRADDHPILLGSPDWVVTLLPAATDRLSVEAETANAVGRERWKAPRDWLAHWVFERRAAAFARAPDFIRA